MNSAKYIPQCEKGIMRITNLLWAAERNMRNPEAADAMLCEIAEKLKSENGTELAETFEQLNSTGQFKRLELFASVYGVDAYMNY